MSYIKLKQPNTGEEVNFEFGHAQRILKSQVDSNIPKKSCWSMIKSDNKNPKDNGDKSIKSKSVTKGEKKQST